MESITVKQICVNVVGNAIKFTNDGEVSLSARVEDCRLLIAIADSGIGISEEGLKKLFSWFYQVDTSHARKYNGTGLGLFISRKLAELLGGELTVHSEPGSGSVFTLSIPLADVVPSPEEAAEAAAAAEQTTAPAATAGAGAEAAEVDADPEALPLAGRTVALCTRSSVTRFDFDSEEHPPADCVVLDIPPGQAAASFRRFLPRTCTGPRTRSLPRLFPPRELTKPLSPPPAVRAVAAALYGASLALSIPGLAATPGHSPPATPEDWPGERRGAFSYRASPTPPASSGSGRTSANPPNDLRILVVEDVEVNRRIVMCMLEKRGYVAVSAARCEL
eukprot:tig00000227_g19818.t1